MKTLFITGAFGFIGSHLLELLKDKKYKIKCLSHHSVKTNYNVEVIYGDVLKPEYFSKYLKDVDVVIHLAAEVKSSKGAYVTNVEGTRNIINECKKHKIKRLIHISSVSAYLDSLYGISKRDSELLVLNSNLDYTVLRPTSILGKESHGMKRILEATHKYPFIPVIGSGKCKMNPVHVKDVAETISKCIENKKTIRNSYSIAGPDVVTYNDFISMILRIIKINKRLVHIPVPVCYLLAYLTNTVTVGGIKTFTIDTNLDISKTKKDLNYNPLSLEKALKEILT